MAEEQQRDRAPAEVAPAGSQLAWNCRVAFDGVERAALEVGRGAGFARTLLVDGIPPGHEDPLLWAAQVSPNKHTWRVLPPGAEIPAAPDPGVLRAAREVLRRDVDVLGSRFVTFFGEEESGAGRRQLLGCAAIRRVMSEGFTSRFWFIVNRALILPQFEGRFFGLLLIPLTKLGRTLGPRPSAGFLISTKARVIQIIVRRGNRTIPGQVVALGRKRLPGFDAPVTAGVFQGTAERLSEALAGGALSPGAAQVLRLVERVWYEGADWQRCAELGRGYLAVRSELLPRAADDGGLAPAIDFLESCLHWGVLEADVPAGEIGS